MSLTRYEEAVSLFSPSYALNRAKKRMALDAIRNYDAASRRKRNKNWKANITDKNSEIRLSGKALTARARDLYNNNPYAKRGIDTIVNNTIGNGIIPDFTNQKAQDSFKKWVKQCDYHERLDFYSIQALVMETIARDGEVFVWRKRKKSTDNIEIPIQLQILEPEFLADHLNQTLDNGNEIVDGIEISPTGKRIAYYFHKEHPTSSTTLKRDTFRVLAKNIAHGFKMERANQLRGVTWLHAVMQRLRDFDDWENTQLMKMKLSSCYTGFIRTTESDSEFEEMSDDDYELEPGTIKRLPMGTDIEFPNPPKVEGLSEYNNIILHAIATGLGITYEQLTNDLSEVNYSSIRAGWLEHQRNVKSWRAHVFYPVMDKIMSWVIEAMDMKGIRGNMDFTYTPPRREMIDPTKEIPALITGIRGGIHSWSEVQRSQGNDPEAMAMEIQKDFERFNKLGLSLDSDPNKVQKNGQFQNEESNNEA